MNTFEEYLDILGEEDREYTSSFFKKKEYIEKLNETAINNCGNIIYSGKGNCNSKIAVIVDKKKNVDDVIRFIKPLFEAINTSLWNIYITCIEKDDNQNELWDQMIQYEMNAISPSFVLTFTDKENSFIEKDITFLSKAIPSVNVTIEDVQYVLNEDNFKTPKYTEILNVFYSYVLKLIPLREIEIAE